jgi:hypothetical protein
MSNGITNPEGYNQYKPDPRQEMFLANYLDPKSETWSNAYQSAIRAGYTDEYAQNITGQGTTWLSENLSDTALLQQAMVNLQEFLGTDDEKLQGIRADMTKFTFKGLQKQKWSERSEMTGKDGKDLIPEVVTEEERNQIKALLGK